MGYKKDNKIYPLGPFDHKGAIKAVICRSRSYASNLHDRFSFVTEDELTDELKKAFEYEAWDGKVGVQDIKVLMLSKLPTGSYIRKGYFLIEDVERYEKDQCTEECFYVYKSPEVYAAMLKNEALLGPAAPKIDCEGNPIETYSASDFMYYAYPDYSSENYESSLIRDFADVLETYPTISEDNIVVLETEG
ncbi:MAG: hypothetical protein IJ757_09005 [Clostridiales bacterium]|nr:hypothetical protein [Clostridiales bacterium]